MFRLSAVLFCLLSVLSAPLNAQSSPYQVAPGLSITNGTLPWVLESYQGKLQLVPIHHSTVEINKHTGANLAGSFAGSFFYKPKMTTELATPHARTRLHSTTPVFYLYMQEEPDNAGDSPKSETATWAIVAAVPDKDRRIFAQVRYTQITGNAKRQDGFIDAETVSLPGNWLRITPKKPLEPGEYAITPIFKSQGFVSNVIYDFGIEPSAPNASDAITANE